jgi:acyl-coenzyme A thioesterase PaaI-like protein
VATVVDSACGYAAYSLMPADAAVLSVEFKINLLAPARGTHILACGRVTRAGRTITVCEGEAIAVNGDDRQVVAAMMATMLCVRGRPGLTG